MARAKLPSKAQLLDEDTASEDDDLDIVETTTKEVDLLHCEDDEAQASSSTTEASDASLFSKRKRGHEHQAERVAWSDNEESDAVYKSFKSRKTDQRKRAATQARKAKAKASDSAIVGRRPKRGPKTGGRPANLQKCNTFGTDSEEDAEDKAVPAFIRTRRNEWEEHRRKLDAAGLNLPPNYDDVDFSDDERVEVLAEKPVLPHLKPCSPYQDVELRYSAGIVPAPIAQWLRDYQVKGAEFLHEMFVYQKGGILGDDMGLGKTIQVIAFLTAAFGKTGDERDMKRMRKMRRMRDDRWYPKVLIICPGGLMNNWKSELDCWGWWQVDIYHGSQPGREAVLSSAKQGRLEIMITTYTTFRNHIQSINLVDWDCVIADECHQIKERKSATSIAMNEVNALCRIGLTGTAIQNNYDELWTILNWTNPGRFGPLSAWRTSIGLPLKIGQSHDATVAQLAMARKTAKKLVINLLPSFFLRRMKTLIADQLPKKSDKVVFCPLTEIQKEAYENLVESDLIDYIRTSADMCACNSGKKNGWCCRQEIPGHGKWQHYVFPMLMTLQKLANHNALLIPSNLDNKERQEKDVELLQIALPKMWRELYENRDSIVNYANQNFCGKWKVLKKLLRFWHQNGDKVLVFSHSVRLLKMLQMLFKSTTSYNVSYLDGSMNYDDRAAAVKDYNTSPLQFVFLISTKAGGVGLNITSANKVVVFDPNWNPSYDLQAQDRAYRIGQTRDVEVFRLVSSGTIEEIVYARQIYKQQQANIAYNASLERRYFSGVQDQKDKKGELFGLKNMFSFENDNVVLRDIVNKTNVAESKAGVSIIGLDTSQDSDTDTSDDPLLASEKEDAAMSQLAALITDADTDSAATARRKAQAAERKKTDAVAAILAGAGVEYTHENSEVIGSSRIETRLSRRAEAAGNDADLGDDYVFSKSQASQRAGSGSGSDVGVALPDHDGADGDHAVPFPAGDGGGVGAAAGVRYRYRPPEQIRRRQFVSLGRSMGYADATDFALVVESWTQERRRDCLDRFYRERRRELGRAAVSQ